MIRMLCFTTVLALAVSVGRADPYWIAYEGNEFPENEGWTRITGPLGGAQRFIENGALVLDSRASTSIVDFYRREMNGQLDPDPGELFIMQWRLKIDEVVGLYDVVAGVFFDENWAAAFQLNEDTIFSTFEAGVSASFQPGVFHDFELRSADMRSYELYIDNVLAIQGSFWLSLQGSRVGWGDGVQGAASLSRWDYVRFGVVPEPGAVLLMSFLGPWLIRAQRR